MLKESLDAKDKEKVLLTFLKRTKEGEYAPIDEVSLPYSRINEESETIITADEFYYGVS